MARHYNLHNAIERWGEGMGAGAFLESAERALSHGADTSEPIHASQLLIIR
jgi:hypothetical protein